MRGLRRSCTRAWLHDSRGARRGRKASHGTGRRAGCAADGGGSRGAWATPPRRAPATAGVPEMTPAAGAHGDGGCCGRRQRARATTTAMPGSGTVRHPVRSRPHPPDPVQPSLARPRGRLLRRFGVNNAS
ncbi:MAG: hypothetical protein E7Z95_03270 [Actinomyces succiniciruminis]|nr:hypothetical protein [Actinomyces succiniciruminis]